MFNLIKQIFVRQPTVGQSVEEELAFLEAEFEQEAWNEFNEAEIEQLLEDGWDDLPPFIGENGEVIPRNPMGYAAEPPKHNDGGAA